VERLFAEHGGALQAFFHRRIRTKADASDLAQEVYLRMLRVPDADLIRSPERYLFTVAANLVKEYGVLESRRGLSVDPEDPAIQPQLGCAVTFERDLDGARRIARLRPVLRELSPKCRAAVALHYRDGLSYEEVAGRLGVSSNMVKKYLVQALVHCRRRMVRLG